MTASNAVALHQEVEMVNAYPLLYRVGLTPWEGQTDRGPIESIVAARAPGRALDAGCGTGVLAVELAGAGWQVTGVDGVGRALGRAVARAAAAGLTQERCRFVRGDVTHLDSVLPDAQLDLITDVGCFHGLDQDQQDRFARWVTAHTEPGADLVVLAAEPRRGLGPRGVDQATLLGCFGPSWTLVSRTQSTNRAEKGPLKGASFQWFHLHR